MGSPFQIPRYLVWKSRPVGVPAPPAGAHEKSPLKAGGLGVGVGADQDGQSTLRAL
jgi:hypothetical protein